MDRYLVAALVGCSVGALAILAFSALRMLARPVTACPSCGQVLPRIQLIAAAKRKQLRIPDMGWHCPKCQAVVDRKGTRIP